MPRKSRDPFAYIAEPDGSVGLYHKWRDLCVHVGHFRAVPGGNVVCSPTYEEPEDFSFWESHPSVGDAFRSLVQARIAASSGHGDDGARERSLRAAAVRIPSSVGAARGALLSAARLAVARAVANMLLIAPYADVMNAVADALASEVIGS